MSLGKYRMVELRVSYPVLVARFLEHKTHAQLVRQFGPDYCQQQQAETEALADFFGRKMPWAA